MYWKLTVVPFTFFCFCFNRRSWFLDFVFGFPFGLASPVSVANTVFAMSLALREVSSRKGEGQASWCGKIMVICQLCDAGMTMLGGYCGTCKMEAPLSGRMWDCSLPVADLESLKITRSVSVCPKQHCWCYKTISTAPWELPFDVAVTSDCDNRRWQLEPGKGVTVSPNRSLSWDLARTTWQMLSLSYHWMQNNVRNPALAKMMVMSAKGYNHNPLPMEEKYVGQVTEEHPVAEVITALTWETLQFSSRSIINECNLSVIWVGFSICLIQWVWDSWKNIFSCQTDQKESTIGWRALNEMWPNVVSYTTRYLPLFISFLYTCYSVFK